LKASSRMIAQAVLPARFTRQDCGIASRVTSPAPLAPPRLRPRHRDGAPALVSSRS
jgi:hypothetical protein